MREHISFNGTTLDDALLKGGSIPAVQLLMNPQDLRKLYNLTDDPKVLKWICEVLLNAIDSKK